MCVKARKRYLLFGMNPMAIMVKTKLPVFVYIHGDAWISTDAVDVDTYMQDITDGTPCKVVEGTIDCETKQRSSFNCCAVKSNLLEAPQSGPLLILFAVD